MRLSQLVIRSCCSLAALAAGVVSLSAAPEPAPTPAAGAATPAPAQVVLPTDPAVIKADSSHAFGYQFGQLFLQQLGSKGVVAGDVDVAAFMKGFEKSIGRGRLDEAETEKLGAALQAFDKMLQERRAANQAAGEKFLAENKTKPGVTVSPSGLQYEILKAGTGPKYEGDGSDQPQFKVRYEGRFVDGKKFDGNMQGEPATFTLQVIPGFKEALMAMPTGSIWRLFIPSKLAYGDEGAGAGAIPPASTLIFDLELVEVAKAPVQAPASATTPPIAVPGE